MNRARPILYLMIGFPGAGKTTTSRLISELTGATHLWADHERHSIFQKPTHSKEESDELYAKLNDRTDKLLGEGKSVIYDTNFNYFRDREHMRHIATKHHARTVLFWITTPLEVSEHRAVHDSHDKGTRIWGNMTHDDFHRIASHLEQPRPEENALQLDGSQPINEQAVRNLLQRAGSIPT